jgi:hypothetical protein
VNCAIFVVQLGCVAPFFLNCFSILFISPKHTSFLDPAYSHFKKTPFLRFLFSVTHFSVQCSQTGMLDELLELCSDPEQDSDVHAQAYNVLGTLAFKNEAICRRLLCDTNIVDMVSRPDFGSFSFVLM